MKEAFGDIWDTYYKSWVPSYPITGIRYDAVVITTNGFVKKNGALVMGRGIALQAKQRFPGLDFEIGDMVKNYGNHVFSVYRPYATLLTMPVKPEYGINGQPGWKVRADLSLIEQSASELVSLIENFNRFSLIPFSYILMPRPGCGNGGLKWENVKPIIEPILDDKFTVMTYPNSP